MTPYNTIFVVEDNLFYQNLVAKSLSAFCGEICFFTSGEDCLAHLDKNPSAIVMDYNLEGTMNGLETIRSIRDSHPETPIVLFSSEKNLNTRENGLRYGKFDFLEKSKDAIEHLAGIIRSFGLSALRNPVI